MFGGISLVCYNRRKGEGVEEDVRGARLRGKGVEEGGLREGRVFTNLSQAPENAYAGIT